MAKSTIIIENILSIADINHRQIKPELLKYLETEAQPTYRDQVLKEHIYNIADLPEELQEAGKVNSLLLEQAEEMIKVLGRKRCSYLRIVYN